MALHLLKLAVGIEDLDHLTSVQETRRRRFGATYHQTRMIPRRIDELCDGGSIYWVVRGVIRARQAILEIETARDQEGRRCARLRLDQALIRTVPRPQRAFQGWRYLAPADAPQDLAADAAAGEEMPPEIWAELRTLGLL